MLFTITKDVETCLYFNEFGIMEPNGIVEESFNFLTYSLNTVDIYDELTGSFKKVHEVIFTVQKEGGSVKGYCTKLVEASLGETEESIVAAARQLLEA